VWEIHRSPKHSSYSHILLWIYCGDFFLFWSSNFLFDCLHLLPNWSLIVLILLSKGKIKRKGTKVKTQRKWVAILKMAWKDHFGPFTIQIINFQSLDFLKFYFSPKFYSLFFSHWFEMWERKWLNFVSRKRKTWLILI
jgi:hypothetical protein